MRQPSKERGCDGKRVVGREYKEFAECLARRHKKVFGVYECPHCGHRHFTTKIHKQGEYAPLLYVTKTGGPK